MVSGRMWIVAILVFFMVITEAASLFEHGPEIGSNFPDLYEASISELQAGLDGGHFTSVDLVKVSFTSSSCDIMHITLKI